MFAVVVILLVSVVVAHARVRWTPQGFVVSDAHDIGFAGLTRAGVQLCHHPRRPFLHRLQLQHHQHQLTLCCAQLQLCVLREFTKSLGTTLKTAEATAKAQPGQLMSREELPRSMQRSEDALRFWTHSNS